MEKLRHFTMYILQGHYLKSACKPYSWYDEQMVLVYNYIPEPEFF